MRAVVEREQIPCRDAYQPISFCLTVVSRKINLWRQVLVFLRSGISKSEILDYLYLNQISQSAWFNQVAIDI